MKRINLTGQQIGFWQVGESFKKNGKIYYKCKCTNCGKEKEVNGSALNTGRSTSCGCAGNNKKAKSILNENFGLLHVEEKIIINGHTYWRCSCQCGGSKIVEARHLVRGAIRTCGCRSEQSENVKNALQKYLYEGTYIPEISCKTLNKNNTSGHVGVGYRKDRNKYRAYIKVRGKNISLGNYDRYEDAVSAREIGEKEYFGKIISRYEEEKNEEKKDEEDKVE